MSFSNFFVAEVQDSPVSSMKQKGNLTGNARLMRDHVIEMANLIQTWNEQLLEGITLITEIKNIMLKKMYVPFRSKTFQNIDVINLPMTCFTHLMNRISKKTEFTSHTILQESCHSLHKISANMVRIIKSDRLGKRKKSFHRTLLAIFYF